MICQRGFVPPWKTDHLWDWWAPTGGGPGNELKFFYHSSKKKHRKIYTLGPFWWVKRVSIHDYLLEHPFSLTKKPDSSWRWRSGGSGTPGGPWRRVACQDFFGIINSDCSKSTKSPPTTTGGGSAGVVGWIVLKQYGWWEQPYEYWMEFAWIWYATPPPIRWTNDGLFQVNLT